jgi:hypothetical protein
MLYVHLKNGLPTKVLHHKEFHDLKLQGADVWAKAGSDGWQSRWDWTSFGQVCIIAQYLTAMTGKTYLGADAGSSTTPRYDIIEAPQVGDPISYGFNGDYYPDGHIERITKNWMVVSTTGSKYNRSRQGAGTGWLKVGGTWSMVAGHIFEQNPSF